MFIKQLTVGMMGVCCYIAACEETREGMVIDPGGDEDKIIAECDKESISIRYLVNTHGHPDHVCGNARLQQALGAGIVMHSLDAEFFSRPQVKEYFAMLGLPASPPPDRTVEDGDQLTIGRLSFRIIHTPGHTPGGMCLYCPPHLFAGDTLFVGAVGRTDFPGGDTDQLMDSIRSRLLSLPPETVVWPGHGYGGDRSTIGDEKRDNPFLNGGW